MPRAPLFDGLGPFSITELREIADQSGINALVGSPSPELLKHIGVSPIVLLWRESPNFGHFVLLHPRRGGLEVFDPLGANNGVWDSLLDDPARLNGGGLRKMLQDLYKGGVKLSFNALGPQRQNAMSCGLFCLLRAAISDCSPSEFRKNALIR